MFNISQGCVKGPSMSTKKTTSPVSSNLWAMILVIFGLTAGITPAVAKVELSHVSTVYLPAAAEQKPEYAEGAVEQIAYDSTREIVYAAGDAVYHVISMSDPKSPVVELTRYEDGVDFTDIDICGDFVFMVLKDKSDPQNGMLRVYSLFEKSARDQFQLVDEIRVGPDPDMLTVRKDCRTVLVAIEGDGYEDGNNFVNPEGTVAIVKFPDVGIGKEKATIKVLGFGAFNNRYAELKPSGVRFVYKANSELSNDLEPEYISIDEGANKAYVCLQENNAIAEVDLVTETVTHIHGLGYKEWGALDASDKDTGIRITYWPIRAWYMPDAMKLHQWQGRSLIFTANEGNNKEFDAVNFDETIRGVDIDKDDLGDGIHEIVRKSIDNEDRLGRLKFARYDGIDESTGKYNALYALGGRSFSIWDVTVTGDMAADVTVGGASLLRVFDSGSEFEEMTALHCPHLFNGANDDVDDRSDEKGPEPESIALGEIGDRLYIFIGNERPGTIFVYSLGRDVTKPRFETIFCEGIPESSKSLKDLFDDRSVYAVDPEDIRFYSAEESPIGRPVLMVAGTTSGTVSLLEIKVTPDPRDSWEAELNNEPDVVTG